MTDARSGVTIPVCVTLLGWLLATGQVVAQNATTVAAAEQQKAERDYAEILGHVQQGDMTVDFRAFRVAGALKSGPHASMLEAKERAAFRSIAASGDWMGALELAKRALDRNYASLVAHSDAMAAYQAMGKADEAGAHEKILNALLDSIRQSGDGKSPETAYFVVTVQEEYIFLNRVLNVRAKSQDWVRKDGHFYDRLAVPDSTTNQVGYLWFNADFDASSDPAAIAAVKDGVLATTTAIRPGDASVSSRVGPEAGPANSIRGASLGPGQLAEGLLHNEDVIKMVKAGFDDALIIEKVGNSKCQFDTSADALIQLKQSGASGPVVRAVMEAGAPRGLALTGHVVWNGLPVPNAKVQLAHRDSVSAPASARTVTANDGAFTIQDPPAGDLMIWVYAPSSEYTDLAGRAVTITAGHPENIGSVSITKKLQLLSPTVSEIATTTPALEWAPFPDSVRYNVYVFNDSTRQRILLRSTKDTRMTVPAPLPNGQQLRWGVQAYNSKGEEIAVSWWRFTIASPKTAANTSPDRHEPATLIQRSNAQTQVTGRVVWNGIPVPNAGVQLRQAGSSQSLPVLASTVSAADGTFTIEKPLTGRLAIYALAPTTDYWPFQIYRETIIAGQSKNVGDLAIAKKMQLLSPANGASLATTTPTLQWTAFPGTARYDVSVRNDATSQQVFLHSTQGTQVTLLPALQGGQKYEWTVQAYNSSGQRIAWSVWTITTSPNPNLDLHQPSLMPEGQETVQPIPSVRGPIDSQASRAASSTLPPGTPRLLTPADGSVFDTFPRTTAVSWTAVPGAVEYRVEVDFSSSGEWASESPRHPIPPRSYSSKTTSISFDFVGAQPGRWRVSAIDRGGRSSEPSPWWSFRYTR
jgi:hypothetical protein